jgi:hypothetical protein
MPNLASLMLEEHIFIFFLEFNILKWQEIAKAWKCSEKRGRNNNFTWIFWKFKIKNYMDKSCKNIQQRVFSQHRNKLRLQINMNSDLKSINEIWSLQY